MELTALEEILEPYLTPDSKENFELSRKHLGSWDIEGNERYWSTLYYNADQSTVLVCNRRVEEIVTKFKKNTRLQLKCFQVMSKSAVESNSVTENSEQDQS